MSYNVLSNQNDKRLSSYFINAPKNMNEELITWLMDIGLEEQLAKIYLLTLSKGSCRASDISKELKLNRTAIYNNLDRLEELGYVIKIKICKQLLYSAISPKDLNRRMKVRMSRLEDLMPLFLMQSKNSDSEPVFQFFQGKDSARNVFEDILKVRPKEYFYISNPVETYKTLSRNYIEKWIEKRVKLNIHSKGIRTVKLESAADKVFSEEKPYKRTLRYLPANMSFGSTIYIYGDSVGIISSFKENRTIIIKSKDIAYTFEQFFNLIWQMSNKS
jgi:sugar-specific transcriptional regulator TrmB